MMVEVLALLARAFAWRGGEGARGRQAFVQRWTCSVDMRDK